MLPDSLPTSRLVLLLVGALALVIAVLQLPAQEQASIAGAAPMASPTPSATDQLVAAAPAAAAPAVAAAPVPAAAVPEPEPVTPVTVQKRGGVACAAPHRLVTLDANSQIRARPMGRAKSVGTLPARSIYLGQQTTAWVQRTSKDGRWGLITLPWSKPVGRTGWVRLSGTRSSTRLMAVADLSQRRMTIYRGCKALFNVRTAIGRPGSPSPKGRFWVSDRISVPTAQRGSFGSYAFGLSTVQPNLPAGWTGGDQMAIHGTGAPGSIGEAASAGCLRVSEDALARLKPLLRAGTPVIITA